MPRGDGKKLGEPRSLRKQGNNTPWVPPKLRKRIQWWESQKWMDPVGPKDKHDRCGNVWRKPGSQKKGRG